jgi:two-component system nitrate/nitrite sensor histidine kinase NarX
VREKTDLSGLLAGLLKNFHEALEADYSMLIVVDGKNQQGRSRLAHGELPESNRPLVEGVLNSVLVSAAPVMLGNVGGDGAAPGVRSLIAAPLATQEEPALGALLVASRRSKTYSHRQLAMLQTFAGQAALAAQNANRLAELEYKTILQERKRLAREIHDSFAQTLGFLKLRVAQLRQYVETGDTAQIQKVVPIIHQALSEAYRDVRQAIDGLQVTASAEGLREWLPQITADFSELSGLEVEIQRLPAALELPEEIQVQLIRIIQEALNNVRKHAQASRVWVDFEELPGELVCEVRDDGRGFDPEDLPGPSQYGLRGMRERADLIGADFQVISRAGSGAVVRLSLPLESLGESL